MSKRFKEAGGFSPQSNLRHKQAKLDDEYEADCALGGDGPGDFPEKGIFRERAEADVEPDTEHGMSSEELAGRFGAHFEPAAAEAGVEREPDQSSSARADAVTQFEFHGTSPSSVEGAKLAKDFCEDMITNLRENVAEDKARRAEDGVERATCSFCGAPKICREVAMTAIRNLIEHSAEAGVEVEREEFERVATSKGWVGRYGFTKFYEGAYAGEYMCSALEDRWEGWQASRASRREK